jgi:glycosylphosphatidylinositol phospholipase D
MHSKVGFEVSRRRWPLLALCALLLPAPVATVAHAGSEATSPAPLSASSNGDGKREPKVTIGLAWDSGVSDTDRVTEQRRLDFSGSAPPLSTVDILRDAKTISTVTANHNGRWQAKLRGQPFGVHRYAAAGKDAEGNDLSSRTIKVTIVNPRVVALDELDEKDGFAIDGLRGGSWYKPHSLAIAGDVNCDGVDDVLIGAPYTNIGPRSYQGSAFVVFGRKGDTGKSVDVRELDGKNGFRLAALPDFHFALPVTGIEDFNGDGCADIAFAQLHREDRPAQWRVAVIFGRPEAFPAVVDTEAETDGERGLQVIADLGGVRYEKVLSLASSDLNGDGLGDLVIGAPEESNSVFVVFGSAQPRSAVNVQDLDGTNGFRISGRSVQNFGAALDTAGDVNADGIEDLLIGALGYGWEGRGGAYVLFGRSSGFPSVLPFNPKSWPGLRFTADEEWFSAAESVSGVGDVNGDGYGDILTTGSSSGEAAFLVFGRERWPSPANPLNELRKGSALRFLDHGTDADRMAVSKAGDFDGDGIADFAVSLPRAFTVESGKTFVFYGAEKGLSGKMNLEFIDRSQGFTIVGPEDNYMVGLALAGGGDINGDGRDDLVLSAPSKNPRRGDRGSAYVVFGKPRAD